jgi:hypothetical protein
MVLPPETPVVGTRAPMGRDGFDDDYLNGRGTISFPSGGTAKPSPWRNSS